MEQENIIETSTSGYSSAGNRFCVSLLTIITIFSGCCALAYEVLYVRVLTVLLGDMFYIHAALLSTFLIGIGIGSKCAHKYLRWLWAFEILTGLYAIAMPLLSNWLSQQPIMAPITSNPILTIITTILFVAIPGLLIGISIPLFSAYLKAQYTSHLGFQGIYRAYNLGAFLSILVVELIIIRLFGVKLSLIFIGVINILNGFLLLVMRLAPAKSIAPAQQIVFPRRIIWALCIGSLSSAVFQMFFFKLSYLVFYPHRENFAIGLSVVMFGIFLGAWLASKTSIRFETLLILSAALIGLIYWNYMPLLRFFEATVALPSNHESLIIAHKFAFGCVFALAPMIFFGALIPSLMRTEKDVATESGHLLWISSLSNAAGYLVYVLFCHQFFSTNVLLVVICVALIAASFIAAGFRWSKSQIAIVLFAILFVVAMNFRWQEKYFYLAHWINKLKPEEKVTVFKSGAESASLVQSDESSWISYNGHPSIFFWQHGYLNTPEMLSGIIPALNAPSYDRALVIGFGTGITAGTAAKIFDTTDVVEINDAFYKMMPTLSHINFDIENNPSAKLHLADGRAFLVGKDETYDVIINSVSAPTYFSASKIYTVEFYEMVVKSLKPDGVFCLWLRAAEMSEEGILTILSALQHNFSYCQLRVMKDSYYMATCYNQPVPTRKFSELPVHQDVIEHIGKNLAGFDFDEFFEDIVVSLDLFGNFSVNLPQENTDDHPVLEFQVVRAVQLKEGFADPFLIRQEMFKTGLSQVHDITDNARFLRKAGTLWAVGSGFFKRNFMTLINKDLDTTVEFLLWSSGYLEARGKPEDAIAVLKNILRVKPASVRAHYGLGTLLESNGNIPEAIKHYQQVLSVQPDFSDTKSKLEKLLDSQRQSGPKIK